MSDDTSLAELQARINDDHEAEMAVKASLVPANNGYYWVKLNGSATYNGLAQVFGYTPFKQIRAFDLFGYAWVYGSDGDTAEALQTVSEWGPPLAFPPQGE